MPIYVQSVNVRKVLYGGTPPGELLSELHWNRILLDFEPAETPKSVIFGMNLPGPKGYIPLSDFSKIWHGEGSPRFDLHVKFYHFGLVNVGLRPTKNANLWYTFAPKGYISLGRFLLNYAWRREPQDRTVVRNFNVVALKLWPYGTKNCQKRYFW